jgi:hypothetical protein
VIAAELRLADYERGDVADHEPFRTAVFSAPEMIA